MLETARGQAQSGLAPSSLASLPIPDMRACWLLPMTAHPLKALLYDHSLGVPGILPTPEDLREVQ